jgi:predicted nucleic acid-binding Zn ribbon protein
MKNSNEQTLKEAILALLEEYRLKDGLQESRLISSWDNVAGKFIASNTESIYIRKKNLYIRLNSAALKHELRFAKSDLINSLNKSVGQEVITDIIFL